MNDLERFAARYGPKMVQKDGREVFDAGKSELGPLRMITEVFGATPDDWQAEALRAYGRGERQTSIRSAHNVGKGHPVDTVVPTPAGDRRWGDLVAGDTVWAPDGKPTRIEAVYPRGVLPVYRVCFNDGTHCTVDADHLWHVQQRGRGRIAQWDDVVLDTRTLMALGVTLPNGRLKKRRFRLPVYEPVAYPARAVPVEPYMLGVWLGDGDVCANIHNPDAEIHSRVTQAGGRWNIWGTRVARGRVPGLSTQLRSLGLYGLHSYERFIPDLYRENDVWTRREILRGLLDTDGTVTRHGDVSFSTTSPRLAADLCWLVRSLGGIARLRKPKQAGYRNPVGERVACRTAYIVGIVFEDPTWLFTVARKLRRTSKPQKRRIHRWITTIETAGSANVHCIKVVHPSACYLANDFIPTHNTSLMAWCAWHMLLTKYPQRTVATAPSAPQLFNNLYSEFMLWGGILKERERILYDLFEYKSDIVELKDEPDASFFSLRTSRAETPEALQGIHARFVLLLVDEGSGVPESVYVSGMSSMAGHNCQTILASNPTRTSGFFFNTHHKSKARWHAIHVSGVPGTAGYYSPRVSNDYIEEIAAEYGRESNTFRIRCLGEFPTSDLDKIISWELITAAQKRDITLRPDLREIWGLDVARFGDDANALVRRNKLGVLPGIETWTGRDLMQTAGRVKARWDELDMSRRPDEILIDDIGLGGGVTDRLMEQGLPVRGINVSELPATNPKYRNLRTELWFKGRDWLATRDKSLPAKCECEACRLNSLKDHAMVLATELSLVGFDYTSSGKIIAEPKADIKKMGHGSPNVADAFLLTLASEPASLLHGSGANSKAWSTNWNEPIRRDWAVV